MTTLQERIVNWRYSTESTTKAIIGFWIKALIESGIMIGVPVGLFVILTNTVKSWSFNQIPYIPGTTSPDLLAWIVLVVVAWLKLRCILMEGINLN